MRKSFFFDIDGTLVFTPSETFIRPGVLEAVDALRAQGHLCMIASGRNLGGCRKYLDHFDGAIFSDGAGIYYHDEILYANPIPRDLVEAHIDMVHHQFGGTVLLATQDYTYCDESEYEIYLREAPMELLEEYHFVRMQGIPNEPIYEIDTMFPNEDQERAYEKAKPAQLHYISTTASYGRGEHTSGEVTCEGITKGNGILEMVKALGLDYNETYAFGDSMNDASLLKTAKHGIAMGNGTQELKALADYVTTPIDQDGIIHALQHYGLL